MKRARTQYELIPEIRDRWSPRAFSPAEVETEKLLRMLEAASWAASSRNEQPWRFVIGVKGKSDTWNKVFDCLDPWNQRWAHTAPVLGIVIGKTHFAHNNTPNSTFAYDCGQAMAMLSVQATHDELMLHQMGGIFPDKAMELFSIPSDFKVLAAFAAGYLGKVENIDPEYHASELSERSRKSLDDLVFGSQWGEKAKL